MGGVGWDAEGRTKYETHDGTDSLNDSLARKASYGWDESRHTAAHERTHLDLDKLASVAIFAGVALLLRRLDLRLSKFD